MKHYLPLCIFLLIGAFCTAQKTAWQAPQKDSYQKSTSNFIQIYPNPATSYFGVTEIKNVEKIIIFNLVGRKMKQYIDLAKDKRYYIGDLPNGIYLIQMLDKKSKILATRRISKR